MSFRINKIQVRVQEHRRRHRRGYQARHPGKENRGRSPHRRARHARAVLPHADRTASPTGGNGPSGRPWGDHLSAGAPPPPEAPARGPNVCRHHRVGELEALEHRVKTVQRTPPQLHAEVPGVAPVCASTSPGQPAERPSRRPKRHSPAPSPSRGRERAGNGQGERTPTHRTTHSDTAPAARERSRHEVRRRQAPTRAEPAAAATAGERSTERERPATRGQYASR